MHPRLRVGQHEPIETTVYDLAGAYGVNPEEHMIYENFDVVIYHDRDGWHVSSPLDDEHWAPQDDDQAAYLRKVLGEPHPLVAKQKETTPMHPRLHPRVALRFARLERAERRRLLTEASKLIDETWEKVKPVLEDGTFDLEKALEHLYKADKIIRSHTPRGQ